MKTDWNLIRNTLNAAIDACEVVEQNGGCEELRGKTIELENGNKITGFEFLQSLFTYPDNLRPTLIRARHELKESNPYTSETAKTLINVATMCSELVGAKNLKTSVSGVSPHNPKKEQSIEEMVVNLTNWYQKYFIENIKNNLQ